MSSISRHFQSSGLSVSIPVNWHAIALVSYPENEKWNSYPQLSEFLVHGDNFNPSSFGCLPPLNEGAKAMDSFPSWGRKTSYLHYNLEQSPILEGDNKYSLCPN